MARKKKDPMANNPCVKCDTKSVPDCGKCRLVKKYDLVSLLTDDHLSYLTEINRNKDGKPHTLSDTSEKYLAILVHLGHTMKDAGRHFGVSGPTAHRIYSKYKDTFHGERKRLPRKKRAPKSS